MFTVDDGGGYECWGRAGPSDLVECPYRWRLRSDLAI